MIIQLLSGADWLQPAGTDCTACSGSREKTAFVTLNQKGGVEVCLL